MPEIMSEVIRMSREFAITKSGSFCFWGDWFGRPLDNSHKCVKADFRNGLLTADFADGESLTVYGAKGVFSDDGRFYVIDADTVVWEWELYGEPRSEDSRRFIEYKKQLSFIKAAESGSLFLVNEMLKHLTNSGRSGII